MSFSLPERCHRTRQQVSLRLDSELSEFEETLVAAHLARCRDCSIFADDLQVFTETVRSTPAATPSTTFSLPLRRPARFRPALASSASAAAISVAGALVVAVSVYSPSANRISASDIQSARDRMVLKEQLMQELDVARPDKHVPRGVMIARDATVHPTDGAE